MKNKISKRIGVVIVLLFLSMSLMPMITTEAKTPNYSIVHQGGDDFETIVYHNLAEARAYWFEGINDADNYHVAYVYLIDHNEGNEWYSDEYTSNIKIDNGYLVNFNDETGVYSEYPRQDGDGYESSWLTTHNSIGAHTGSYVDVDTMWKHKDWDVSTNNYFDTHHYQGHDDKDWEGATVGGCFYSDNPDHITVELDTWKMEDPSWWGSDYKTIASDTYVYLYP